MRKVIEPNKAEASGKSSAIKKRMFAVTELVGRVFRRRSTVIAALVICLAVVTAVIVWGNKPNNNEINISQGGNMTFRPVESGNVLMTVTPPTLTDGNTPQTDAPSDGQEPESEQINGDVVVGQLGLYMFQLKTSDILYAPDAIGDATVDGVQRMANVTINVDGTTKEYNTQPGTVQAVLDMAGVTLGEYDEVSQDLDEQVKDGATITVSRITYETNKVYKTVKAQKVTRSSYYRTKGSEGLVSKGKDGKVQETYRVKYRDGVKVGEELVDTTVIEKVVNEVYEIGLWEGNKSVFTSNKIYPTAAPKPGTYSKVITARTTAYTHTGNNTASGRYPKVGTVAVAKKYFKTGIVKKYTRLYIEGYGYAIVEDSGDKYMENYNGYWIDVFMDKLSDCSIWGMRDNVKVYILN